MHEKEEGGHTREGEPTDLRMGRGRFVWGQVLQCGSLLLCHCCGGGDSHSVCAPVPTCVCVCVCVTNNQQLSETVWSVPSSPKDFLLQIFTVFRILIRPEMFPKDWTVMRLVANK